jgi:TetR/AcrR family transcriptional regulator, transcriptional repressor for nem operon
MPTLSKRDRLIEAATTLFYHQGVVNTTLADIAQHADIPLGNVYYHFRTKEALVAAVIHQHVQGLQSMFADWERLSDPRERLLALLAVERQEESMLARYGCPHGSLCQELDKGDDVLATTGAELFQTYLEWARGQLRLLGKDEPEASDLAFDFIASLQGAILLSTCFRAPDMLERKLQRLEAWVRSL